MPCSSFKQGMTTVILRFLYIDHGVEVASRSGTVNRLRPFTGSATRMYKLAGASALSDLRDRRIVPSPLGGIAGGNSIISNLSSEETEVMATGLSVAL